MMKVSMSVFRQTFLFFLSSGIVHRSLCCGQHHLVFATNNVLVKFLFALPHYITPHQRFHFRCNERQLLFSSNDQCYTALYVHSKNGNFFCFLLLSKLKHHHHLSANEFYFNFSNWFFSFLLCTDDNWSRHVLIHSLSAEWLDCPKFRRTVSNYYSNWGDQIMNFLDDIIDRLHKLRIKFVNALNLNLFTHDINRITTRFASFQFGSWLYRAIVFHLE